MATRKSRKTAAPAKDPGPAPLVEELRNMLDQQTADLARSSQIQAAVFQIADVAAAVAKQTQ